MTIGIVDGLIPDPEPAELLSAMDNSVTIINEVIAGTIAYHPDVNRPDLVTANVGHLELMTSTRVDELGESPDLSTYQAAITAGKAYLE